MRNYVTSLPNILASKDYPVVFTTNGIIYCEIGPSSPKLNALFVKTPPNAAINPESRLY